VAKEIAGRQDDDRCSIAWCGGLELVEGKSAEAERWWCARAVYSLGLVATLKFRDEATSLKILVGGGLYIGVDFSTLEVHTIVCGGEAEGGDKIPEKAYGRL